MYTQDIGSIVKFITSELRLEYLYIKHMEDFITHECSDESNRSYYQGRIDEKRENIKFLELTVERICPKN